MGSEAAQRVGARIREARQEKRLSQKELGNFLPGIVGGDQVSKWERGEHRPHDDTLAALAKVLDVDLAFFLTPTTKGPTPDLMGKAPENGVDRLAAIERKLDEILDLRNTTLAAINNRMTKIEDRFDEMIANQRELLDAARAVREAYLRATPPESQLAREAAEIPLPDAPAPSRRKRETGT